MNEYTIPKPTYPTAARLYAAAVAIGLIGLGVVAFETFGLFHPWPVALAFGLVIELGAVVESIGLANGIHKQNWWIIPGLAVTLLVSGGYNYMTAQRAGALLTPPITSPAILAAVGVGPLSAIFFIAAQLGVKIREHEAAVQAWMQDRQAWQDKRAAQEKQAQLQREQALAAAQERVQLAQIAAQERAERAAARRAARAQLAAVAQIAQPAQPASAAAQRGTYRDFETAQLARNGAGPMDYRTIMKHYNVSRRTAYSWLAQYSQAHPAPHLAEEIN